ncbi:unnamed protein product [Dovyalis caffra]|uniref:Uncharacterized protein n=1 Tax=Dovyalis caffra TaxID=77055 RepID=A0AAV1QP94_9ROSI|nr:unnamed protein product [Dovyalis caffra]
MHEERVFHDVSPDQQLDRENLRPARSMGSQWPLNTGTLVSGLSSSESEPDHKTSKYIMQSYDGDLCNEETFDWSVKDTTLGTCDESYGNESTIWSHKSPNQKHLPNQTVSDSHCSKITVGAGTKWHPMLLSPCAQSIWHD